ncbi:Hypothetical protein Ldb1405 [Lactobacillus delbrueckii subsp. bulgaricus ATCC 11842 = JCM 1002]|uniref:Uncharacterized protein n=1 Tax=Lactobacillus delbrueckii subsp. bulgaricus (strain ATCC 11842 / DSM 20081 / BCRC 10696 / JCM 1002 / NBRC 13953 / NCIMB 11778 / NCTC 12712 / WDCM 00102 / Lb 14) TaxID=390333 RepID=Q1G9I8_LACDA|nr:Hypothetical protein Ldb1405 [Lactobacillus delbrueckii subsp. bulgaricus ATCC 11842 = JCM 1002]
MTKAQEATSAAQKTADEKADALKAADAKLARAKQELASAESNLSAKQAALTTANETLAAAKQKRLLPVKRLSWQNLMLPYKPRKASRLIQLPRLRPRKQRIWHLLKLRSTWLFWKLWKKQTSRVKLRLLQVTTSRVKLRLIQATTSRVKL